MKFLSDNLLTLILAFILGLSPIQSASASVSKCMNMSTNMHAQMSITDNDSNISMKTSSNQSDCCGEHECASAHCASVSVATIISNNFNNVTYSVSNIYQKYNLVLISSPPTSLFRPPKV